MKSLKTSGPFFAHTLQCPCLPEDDGTVTAEANAVIISINEERWIIIVCFSQCFPILRRASAGLLAKRS